jgi:hypothetical protein
MLEERMKRVIGASLAALSTAAMSICPLLASTRAQAAVAPLDASYRSLKTNTINYGGPATATLVIAGKTYKFKNGTCVSIKVSGITDDVVLGSVVQGKDGGPVNGNGKKPYFSLDISSPTSAIVGSIYSGGKKLTSGGSVTVTGTVVKSGSSKGTFATAPGGFDLSGKPLSLTGSWNCHGKFNKE